MAGAGFLDGLNSILPVCAAPSARCAYACVLLFAGSLTKLKLMVNSGLLENGVCGWLFIDSYGNTKELAGYRTPPNLVTSFALSNEFTIEMFK